MPFDIYNEEFQNWLKGVFGLNTTRTALCECISDKLDIVLSNNSYEKLHQYFLCLKTNNISLLNMKLRGSTDKRWECEHKSCRDIMRYFIDNHKQGHKLKYTWVPLGKSESNGTVVGGGYHCKELKWNVIKLYMHIENEEVMKQCTSLDCLDITHVIKIMRNCKLISTNDLDEPLEEVLASRNKFMHSPDNKMTDIETCNTLQCTRKLLDCLDIAEKMYYKNAVQELLDLSENDFVLRYQSEDCKRILADVLNAKHLAVELNSNIKEDNLPAKSQSKRLQDMLESITGLRSSTNTNLEMKLAEYKIKSKESLKNKIDAIKLDQMECDENSAEYTKLEDLKDGTERAIEEVILITQRMESDEMVDEIEKLRKEKETLKSEIRQNNAEVITQRSETDEMVDEIEKLREEKETLKSEIKQNNTEVITQRSETDEMVDEIEKLSEEKETLKSEIKQNNTEKDEGFLNLPEKIEDLVDLENASLLDEIVRLLDMGRDAEVIMLIGQSGAGKSAMLNTVHMVLTGENFPYARQGAGHAQSVTLDIERYNNFGVDLKTVRDDSRREEIAAVVHKLPHVIDCPGMGDDDSPELREILELLVGGFIPKETQIPTLQSKQEQFGVGFLKKEYRTSNPADRVTKVVFVQSCRNVIPRNLINCLNEVLKITDPTTLKRKYTAEVFLVISKFDLVLDPCVHNSTGSDEDSMTLEDFAKKENELAPEFNIVGALEDNRFCWASYTDKIQGRNKHIENIALKFLKRMVQPGTPQTDPTDRLEPVVDTWKTFQLYMFRLRNQIKQFFLQDMQLNITPAWFVTAVVFVVVIAVLYKLLMASV